MVASIFGTPSIFFSFADAAAVSIVAIASAAVAASRERFIAISLV
jgi:hypothetical protein